jgi:eukaryotic-like serine/threonine-protein kinase
MHLSAGDRLGPYEILAPIGAGGMGEVYRARDPRLNRDVAIKVSAAQFSERFEREAKAIAALNHPNICQIYDVGPNYLVMEFVEGAPLKGPLSLEKSVEYAGQILDALDAAHKKGITHRDLKPANILVTKQGIKLLDFGLAKQAGPVRESDSTVTQGLTGQGQIVGTLQYMSPEQLQGKEADARSDLFSFGCVLYEMLTGKRAFEGASSASVIAAILEREPAPLNLSPPLERVIKKSLVKDPEERFQTARDLKTALLWAVEPQPDGFVVRPRSRWWMLAVAVALALGIGGAWAVAHLGHPAVGDVVTFAIYPPENAAFSEASNTTVNVPQFALAPDGRSIVFSAQMPGARPMLWLRPMEEAGARALPGTEDAQHPFWSPDSSWIGFFAEGKMKKIPAAGGAVQVVVQTAAEPRGGTWGPDGTIVFASGNGPVLRVASSGGPVTPASVLAQGNHRFPQFLPDGRHFLRVVLTSEQSGVYAGSLDDKSTKLLVRTSTSAVYAPPGYLLFVDGDTLLGEAFNADHLEVSGQPFLIAEHVGRSSAFQSAISASRTGIIAYSVPLAQNTRLTWFDRAGEPLNSAGMDGYYSDFRLSPDEKSLAALLVNPKTGVIDIWVNDLARGSNTRITRGELLSASANWSPDGARLTFRTFRGGMIEFSQKSAAGGGDDASVLTAQAESAAQIQSVNLVPTDWSPDGKLIAFSAPTVASGNDLWMLPLTGDRKPVKFLATPADEMHGNFSPDGRFVAYTSNESGRYEVYVQTFPLSDKKWQVSTNGGYEPRWRSDGREIYYLSEDRKLMAVSVGPGPSFGVPQTLFQTRVPAGVNSNRTHYVPSRDGRRFLVNTQVDDPSPNPITVVLNWTSGLKK